MIDVPLALVLLAAGAVGSIVVSSRPRAALAVGLAGVGAAGLVCCVAALQVLISTSTTRIWTVAWPLPMGAAVLRTDALSAWFLLVIGVVSPAVAIYSWGYFQSSIGREPIWAVGVLMSLLVAAMVITVCAGDVILFLIGWELMSLSAFLLVGFHHRDAQTRHGAWMYLIATHLGTAFGVLPVFAAFAAQAGSTSFSTFAGAFDQSQVTACIALFFLGLLGFGTKAGLVPMHVWLPAAHPVAPSPVSALMSAVVIKTGVYGMLRVGTWLPPLPRGCALAVVVIAIVTGVMGILYALVQRQYKRLLAYSSIENIGIIVLGIGVGMFGRTTQQPILVALGFGGALLHVLNHAFFKGLLFLSAGAVLHATGVDDMERLGGIARRDPVNAALFAFGCVAICALPPLNGFVGEFLIYSGLLRGAAHGSPLVAASALAGVAALALIGGLALAAFSKLFGVMFLGEPRDASVAIHATPVAMLAGMSVLALGCVVVGLGAPLVGGLLMNPLAALAGEPLGPRLDINTYFPALAWVSGVSCVAIGATAALFLLRRRGSGSEVASDRQATWGCGYSAPTPRMQYTGSSYVAKLAHGFRSLLRPRRSTTRLEGCFPLSGALSTQTADAAVQHVYQPAFRAVARACERLWPLQHGRIQLYLMYIVATLLLVFAVEAWLSPLSYATRQVAPPSATALSRPPAAPGNPPGGGRTP